MFKKDKKTSTGLEENIAGALAYLVGFITGIVFILAEKDNEFVRFHAMQSTIFFLLIFILSWIPVFGRYIAFLGFIAWLFLMYKAYNGEKYKLPVVGDFAEKQVQNL